jgi:WD40 repeat protein
MNTAVFSPNGDLVVTANRDGTVRVWDATDGRQRLQMAATVYSIAGFSPDGRVVATGDGDGVTRLWDARTGHLVDVLSGHADAVSVATFTPDGRRVLTAGGATIKLFPCRVCGTVSDLVAAVRARVTRPLTADEARLFLQGPPPP